MAGLPPSSVREEMETVSNVNVFLDGLFSRNIPNSNLGRRIFLIGLGRSPSYQRSHMGNLGSFSPF